MDSLLVNQKSRNHYKNKIPLVSQEVLWFLAIQKNLNNQSNGHQVVLLKSQARVINLLTNRHKDRRKDHNSHSSRQGQKILMI